MTAPLAPVIPSSGVPVSRQRARQAAARRLPLASPVPVPSAPGDVVYGIARIDSPGRICERAIITALGWAGGDLLTFTAGAGVVTTMTTAPAVSRQAAVDAALLVLKSMGLSLADLTAAPSGRPPVPTFAEYVPVVAATVTPGTLRAYRPYWRRTVEQWGGRRLDEPSPSEIRQLVAYVRANAVPRRNGRGGHHAAENLISALRCLYQRAVDDGLIDEKDNPARKVAKGRRLPSTRRALDDVRLAEINQVAEATGDDPELDALILRLHTETACRRGGALAIRPQDLDREQCLVLLREKGETFRWQPVSPTLMAGLAGHAGERHAPPGVRAARQRVPHRQDVHRAAGLRPHPPEPDRPARRTGDRGMVRRRQRNTLRPAAVPRPLIPRITRPPDLRHRVSPRPGKRRERVIHLASDPHVAA